MCKDIWNVDFGVWQVYYEQNTSSIVVEGREDDNGDARSGGLNTSISAESIEAL